MNCKVFGKLYDRRTTPKLVLGEGGGAEANYENPQPEYEWQFIHLPLPENIQQTLPLSPL